MSDEQNINTLAPNFGAQGISHGDATINQSSPTADPLTIPLPITDFTGREAELRDLTAALASGGTATITGLRGMGGIGKSQLAFQLAHDLKAHYPKQVMIPLLGSTATPLAPTAALQRIIQHFAPTAQLPDDLPSLTAIYQSCLAEHGQPVLVLADDAADAAQTRPLLPPKGCALIVTSRSHIELDGTVTRNINTLKPKDAIALRWLQYASHFAPRGALPDDTPARAPRRVKQLFWNRRIRTPQSALLGILLLALVLRLIWIVALHTHGLRLDEPEYLQIAYAIRAGGYVDDYLWVRPPLFPLLLAAMLGPTESVLLAQLAHAALGVLLVWLLYRVALVAWEQQHAALLTAAAAACYIPLIAYSRFLLAETLLLLLLAAYLLSLLRLVRYPAARTAALAGVLLALAALVKPVAVTTGGALLVAIWRGSAGRARHALIHGTLALFCGVLVLAPWSLRTSLVHEQFVLIDTTSGFVLWFGNSILEPDTNFADATFASYSNLAERNQAFAARAFENIQREPWATLQHWAGNLVRFWQPTTDALATRTYGEVVLNCAAPAPVVQHGILAPDDVPQEIATRFCPHLRINLMEDVVYLPLLVGVLAALLLRPRAEFVLLALAWVIPLWLVSALTVAQPRIRIPLLPVLLPLAAAGWVWLVSDLRLRSGQARRVAVGGGLLVAMLAVPLLINGVLHARGQYHWEAGNTQAAYKCFAIAAQWYPRRVATLIAAGQAAEALGQSADALEWYRRATAFVKFEPEPRIGTARILLAQGDQQAAEDELKFARLVIARREAWAFAAERLPERTSINAGVPDEIANYGYLMGFYGAEQEQGNPPTIFRVTGPTAAIRFGTQPTPLAVLHLRLSSNRPADLPLPVATIRVGEQTAIQTTIDRTWRTYSILIPPTAHGISAWIETDTFVPARAGSSDDQRPYGIALDWARLEYR